MSTAPERFGINPDSPGAADRLALAEFLSTKGVPDEDIREDSSYERLSLRSWTYIFGLDGERIPIEEAAARSGVDRDVAQRLLRAFGFTDDAIMSLGLTERDLVVLQLFAGASNLLGLDQVTHLSRVIGTSLARVAEALSAAMRVNVEGPILVETSHAQFVTFSDAVTRPFLDELAVAMDRVLRHHILALSQQTWDFEGKVSEVIVDGGGRIVKFIGDEVMFVFRDAEAACRSAAELLTLSKEATIPDVRVGIAYGQVINRYGDLYGPVVNIASRLVQIAASGEVLVTPAIATEASTLRFEQREPKVVKGIDAPLQHLQLR